MAVVRPRKSQAPSVPATRASQGQGWAGGNQPGEGTPRGLPPHRPFGRTRSGPGARHQAAGPGAAPASCQGSWLERPKPQGSTSPTGTAKPTAPAALIGREQHADEQEQDGHQRDHQRDQDIGGWPEAAAVVPEPHLLSVAVVAVGGRIGLLTRRAEDVVWVGVLAGVVSRRDRGTSARGGQKGAGRRPG